MNIIGPLMAMTGGSFTFDGLLMLIEWSVIIMNGL